MFNCNLLAGLIDRVVNDKIIRISTTKSILGRSIVLHEGTDDLGKGPQPGSDEAAFNLENTETVINVSRVINFCSSSHALNHSLSHALNHSSKHALNHTTSHALNDALS